MIGVLEILDRSVPLDGLVTDISEGGALFRPASTFIFERRKVPVALRFADREWRGEIVNVKADGYGIKLYEALDAAALDAIVAGYSPPTPVA